MSEQVSVGELSAMCFGTTCDVHKTLKGHAVSGEIVVGNGSA